MNQSIAVGVAHFVGFAATWAWLSHKSKDRLAPVGNERKRWLGYGAAIMVIEQALIAADWHLPIVLGAGIMTGFGLYIILPALEPDFDSWDDSPMSFKEAKRLDLASATLWGCMMALIALTPFMKYEVTGSIKDHPECITPR